MNKKKLTVLIVLVLLVAAMVAVYFITRPETAAGMKAFSVAVVHKDGTVKEFDCKSDLQYVGEALEKEGIITGAEGPYGMYIKTADGEKAVYEEDNAYWAFYIGEDYASTGVDQTPIEDGAVYKLVYTPAQ